MGDVDEFFCFFLGKVIPSPKSNIANQSWCLEDEFLFGMAYFQRLC